jgi:branched-chain amino acid transport system substrate-binding protein
MKLNRLLSATTSLLVAILISAGCGGQTQQGSTAPLRIGVNLPLTGNLAAAIAPTVDAVKLWQSQVNQKGGLLGRKVELTVTDNKSDPDTAVSVYQNYLSGGMDFILDPSASAVITQESTVAEQHRKLFLAPGGAAPALYSRGYKYIFTTFPAIGSDSVNSVPGLIQSIPSADRPTTVAYLTVNSVAFIQFTQSLKDLNKPLNLQTTVDVTYQPDINDMTPIVNQLKSKNPDIVFGVGLTNDTVLLARALKQQGVHPKMLMFSSTAAALPNFIQLVGDQSEHSLYSSYWEPTQKTPGNADFVAGFHKITGNDPAYISANTYSAMQIYEAAVEATKTFDQTKLRDYIASHTLQTVVGTFKYNVQGFSPQPLGTPVVQFQNGKRVVVAPKAQATASLVYPRNVP